MTRSNSGGRKTPSLAALAAVATIGVAGLLAAGPRIYAATTRGHRAPRIVAAAMVDLNKDLRADEVRLAYSVRVRHHVDKDGHYPFAVVGYTVRGVTAAHGKLLVLLLAEKEHSDSTAHPAIRYRRTKSRPVAAAGHQAMAQVFKATRAFGVPEGGPPPKAPPPTTVTVTTTTTTTAADSD